VKSEEPFSVIVVLDDGGFSRVFKVFSRAESVGTLDDFDATTFGAAPASGTNDNDRATAPPTAPVDSATTRILCRKVPDWARNIVMKCSFRSALIPKTG
jgi:hypothetical protein